MRVLLRISRLIDAINAQLGVVASLAIILSCAISAGNALIRYPFDISSNAWLEVQWYLFATAVMLGAAYTLRRNEHVRVDILYMRLSERGKEWLDLIGTLVLLLPTMGLLAYLAWPRFHSAWISQEISGNAGGLIRWPVLMMLPAGFALVALQGFSEIVKRAAALMGIEGYKTHYEAPLQ